MFMIAHLVVIKPWKLDTVAVYVYNTAGIYHTAGNIGGQLNLVVWRFGDWGSDRQI